MVTDIAFDLIPKALTIIDSDGEMQQPSVPPCFSTQLFFFNQTLI
jgi:hypothetical protein